uniref:L1 transposable element RRM domain-containing protein n=1 Tax=Seriola dumerili TaxID=41447 RepID=A0A3B4V1X0_SERDU
MELKTTVMVLQPVANHETVLHTLELKLADMEDRNRRCNIRIIGLKEGAEGSNSVQYLNRALPEWFPSLQTAQPEIMRAHRIYDGRSARDRPRTLIFNVLRYTTRQAILRAAKKDPVTVDGKRVRFAADYSNHTVKRRQAFTQAMDTVRERGVEFFLLYPVILKIKDGPDYRVFSNSREAEDFLNSRPMTTQERSPRAPAREAISRHTRTNTAQAAAEDP